MAKYENGDIVTYYFVVNDDGNHKQIQGWTDNKDLAKYYMEFHKCKNFTLKSITKPIEEIARILDENNNDEIKIRNIITRDPDGKKGKNTKFVYVPMTGTEEMFITEECNTMLSTTINYSYMDSVLPYLKNKWKSAIKAVLLEAAIQKEVHCQNPKILKAIQYDQLMMLVNSFIDNFGK